MSGGALLERAAAHEPHERFDQLRVELRAGADLQLGERRVTGERRRVRARRRHGVESVADGDCSSTEWDPLAPETIRISPPVEALVARSEERRVGKESRSRWS